MRYDELDPDPWDDCRTAWEVEGAETAEFLLVDPDPIHLANAARTARTLVGTSGQITEFNAEYLDQPVEDLEESASRVAANDAFFINMSGEVEGIGVTISLGVEKVVLKFPGKGVFPEGHDREKRSEAFRRLTQAALDLAESSHAAAVCFGREGVEVAPEDGVHVWDRSEHEEADHSSEARALFADYEFTLDQRFARKKYEVADELAERTGSVRTYHHRAGFFIPGDTFYFVRLMSDEVKARTIERYARRAAYVAERSMDKKPGFGRLLQVYVAVAMAHASEGAIDCARRYDPQTNFRLSIVIVADLNERHLHARRRFGLLTSRGDMGRISTGLRMLKFK
jgi:hypothetical protein